MILPKKALNIILSHARIMEIEEIDISDSLGRVLAEKVYADADIPPFNKSSMDGFAIKSSDKSETFEVIEDIPAGKIPQKKIKTGECARIMTGAMVPQGADKVVPIEDTIHITKNTIHITRFSEKLNISKKGEDIKKEALILKLGYEICPQEIAVFSTIGKTTVKVYKLPKISIISTGSELVEPKEIPQKGQIRNSNGPMLLAQLKRLGIKGNYLGIAKDDFKATKSLIEKGLEESDILILSGGVSVGDYDFVKEALKKCEVEIIFDKIAIKPGKPTTFGVKGSKYVFGLPGNPVSVFIVFELFVTPFINKLSNKKTKDKFEKSELLISFKRENADREQYYPVRYFKSIGTLPIDFHGSAHLHALTTANALMHIKKGVKKIKEGTVVNVRPI
ncbi:hypothetical protein A2246_00575 [candidate division WOR-1 bacterium RIFOXYA2_FULL_37_7]|uniref:Molybdopterin molybdenumtransferase n=1 Tax=candidate division WOR-1 bacterium RIFOXYB2_FULL_37_13 TaxID=1802579 RepID=A0A1F4SQZ8_UNCSA|nr:MAG: hypothetical protein A2246_00575 [candidate division WOR-1 bacterium RIFOXYA2_FULL_37_7]OGC22757.1 MAG: hypothetical protein A2310_05370 [candidate division WOR-1 bacterium RIFOXYB2_FULL_37_13]